MMQFNNDTEGCTHMLSFLRTKFIFIMIAFNISSRKTYISIRQILTQNCTSLITVTITRKLKSNEVRS